MRIEALVPMFLLFSIPSISVAGVLKIAYPWSSEEINLAIAKAKDGDTIELTGRGSANWESTIVIPNTKGVTLQAAEGKNTPKLLMNFPIVITSTQRPAIRIACGSGNAINRISGFKFKGGAAGGDFISILGEGRGRSNLGAYRVDNCYFDHIHASSTIHLYGNRGEITGLIDNCTFHDPLNDGYTIRIRETFKGNTARCYGAESWRRPFSFGNNRFHFIEDCLFEHLEKYQRHDISCDGAGGRYVVRYCKFKSEVRGAMDFIDAHGDGTLGLGRGTRGGEIYKNVFSGSNRTVGRNIVIRGGEFLIFDNSFSTLGYLGGPVLLTEYRASVRDCWQIQYPSLCDQGIPQCVKDNDIPKWYPVPGQVRGTYLWGNIYNGGNVGPVLKNGDYIPSFIKEGRDYWVCTSVEEAKAKGLNPHYSPYAYPHPLRWIDNSSADGPKPCISFENPH